MRIDYHKEYSSYLGRDMEFKVYGHGGKPAMVFPCQNGRFYDWEGFGMLETLGDYLAGRVFSASQGSRRQRMWKASTGS